MMSDVIFIRITDAFVSLISGPLKLSRIILNVGFLTEEAAKNLSVGDHIQNHV
jgi:hypothetical protein